MIFLLKVTVLVFRKPIGLQASCYESEHTAFIEGALPCSDTQHFTVFIAYFWYIECNFFFFKLLPWTAETPEKLLAGVLPDSRATRLLLSAVVGPAGCCTRLCVSLHPAHVVSALHCTGWSGSSGTLPRLHPVPVFLARWLLFWCIFLSPL